MPDRLAVDGPAQTGSHSMGLVKQRRALLESNPPRNNQPATHRIDEPSGEGATCSFPFSFIEPIDCLMPQKTQLPGSPGTLS